jgi:hypothetical protein
LTLELATGVTLAKRNIERLSEVEPGVETRRGVDYAMSSIMSRRCKVCFNPDWAETCKRRGMIVPYKPRLGW